MSKNSDHISKATIVEDADIADNDLDLLQILKKLRLKISRDKNVPAFVVFTDQSLREMAASRPQTEKEFEKIKGVGQKKLKQYFLPFTDVIREYLDNKL